MNSKEQEHALFVDAMEAFTDAMNDLTEPEQLREIAGRVAETDDEDAVRELLREEIEKRFAKFERAAARLEFYEAHQLPGFASLINADDDDEGHDEGS